MKDYRIGLGFDVHKFTKKRKGLILGGVAIPFSSGVEAVSDGDIILHAVSDALCGACSLGDIGDYFPPLRSNTTLDSREIVKFILKKAGAKYRLVNIDLTVITQKPRLYPYKGKIVSSLRRIFSPAAVNVKFKSKENLPVLGGRNALACMAVVLVKGC